MRGEIVDFNESLRRRMAFFFSPAHPRLLDDRAARSPAHQSRCYTNRSAAHAHGVQTVLVSGGFHPTLPNRCKRNRQNHIHANTLEIKDGLLTGEVLGEIVNGEVKARLVREHCERLNAPCDQATPWATARTTYR